MLVSYGNQDLSESLSPSLGNGYLGYNVASRYFYLSQVYNGAGSKSKKASIPNPQIVKITGAELQYSALNMYDTTFNRVYLVPGTDCTILQTQYVHNEVSLNNQRVLAQSITVNNVNGTSSCSIQANGPSSLTSPDLTPPTTFLQRPTFTINKFSTLEAENPTVSVQTVAVATSVFAPAIAAAPGKITTLCIYSAVADSTFSDDPADDTKITFDAIAKQGWSGLWKSHMHSLYDGSQTHSIEVGGNLELAQKINASQFLLQRQLNYYISGSTSSNGLALTSNGQGRISWDAEMWIFPIAYYYRWEVSKDIFLGYRKANLEAAKSNAKNHKYDGAMFPWESGFSGQELCSPDANPQSKNCRQREYVSASFAVSMFQYSRTMGLDWMEYQPTITAIVEYWFSRVTPSKTRPGGYDIIGTATPDDNAGVVTNSAYVNALVYQTMNLYIDMFNYLYFPHNYVKKAMAVRDGLLIPFDEEKQIHLAYEGYDGQEISAADVVLMNFHVGFSMLDKLVKNDLEYYQARLDVTKAPSTTWSAHTIGWLQVNETARAAETFKLSEKSMQAPFYTWSNAPSGTGLNELSSAAAYLQSLVFGYAGMRNPSSELLLFAPVLPPNTKSITFRGIQFAILHNFTIRVTEKKITISEDRNDSPDDLFVTPEGQKSIYFDNDDPVTLPAGTRFSVQIHHNS